MFFTIRYSSQLSNEKISFHSATSIIAFRHKNSKSFYHADYYLHLHVLPEMLALDFDGRAVELLGPLLQKQNHVNAKTFLKRATIPS